MLWTAKESLVKKLETGFAFPMHLLSIENIILNHANGYLLAHFTHFPTFQVALFHQHSVVIALCTSSKILIGALQPKLTIEPPCHEKTPA